MKYEGRVGKPEDIRKRTFTFAVRVINLCRALPKDEANRVLIRQVIRSATSIGANLEEAIGAHTRSEFINSTNIARKESRETFYWLQMIYEVNPQAIKDRTRELVQEANEIVSILTVSIKRLQSGSIEK